MVRGTEQNLQQWIDGGSDALHRWDSGSTLLHNAASFRDGAFCKVLLDAGVPIDDLDSLDETALHIAVGRANHTVVKLLLERSANVNAINSHRKTPLDLVPERDPRTAADIISPYDANTELTLQLLRSHGAKPYEAFRWFSWKSPKERSEVGFRHFTAAIVQFLGLGVIAALIFWFGMRGHLTFYGKDGPPTTADGNWIMYLIISGALAVGGGIRLFKLIYLIATGDPLADSEPPTVLPNDPGPPTVLPDDPK